MAKKIKNLKVADTDNLEQIEEEILEAASKAGKKNVIVNIFAYPVKKLKRRYKVRYKFNKKHLVMDLIIAGIVLFLIGLNIFWMYGGFRYFVTDIDLQITSQTENFVSGKSVVFEINYENKNKYKIEEVELSLKLPENFEMQSVSAENYNYQNNTLFLGDLPAGANGQIKLYGAIWGDVKSEQFLFSNLIYYKTNKKGGRLWGQFHEDKYFTYTVDSSLIQVDMIVPDKIVDNQIFDVKFDITNLHESLNLENISVNLNWQDNKLIPIQESEIFIDELLPNQTQTLYFKAKAITAGEPLQLKAQVFYNYKGIKLLQAEQLKDLEVLISNFVVNQNVEQVKALNPGEKINLELEYNNQGEFSLSDVKVGFIFSGDYWSLASLDNKDFIVEGDKIYLDKTKISNLMLIQPGENKKINLSLKLQNYIANPINLDLRVTPFAEYVLSNNQVYTEFSSQEFKLNSNLNLNIYPIYYSAKGEQLGRGPLPAKVGQETKYWVFAKVINDINEVKDVKVSIKLPSNVTYSGKSSVMVGNAIEYNSTSRELVWQISQVPIKVDNFGFAVELGIIPTQSQVGTFPLLLKDMVITGQDSNTGETISKNLGNLNINLKNDLRGIRKDGVVLP